MLTTIVEFTLSNINNAADWVADRIISEPEINKKHAAEIKASEVAAAGVASYGLGLAATAGGIALTETMATAGFGVVAVEATAAIAAAGTEVAAGGIALASGGAEVIAIGSALLFSGAVAAKVAVRAAGHAYHTIDEYMTKYSNGAQEATTSRLKP